jgi:hypothetical protein
VKRSHIIVLLVGLALVLATGMLVKSVSWKEITVPIPLQGEAATNSYYAAQRLVRELGARAERRYSLAGLPSTDAIILLSNWNWGVIEQRRMQLQRWVESGGRLVIDNSLVGGEQVLKEWSGLAISASGEFEAGGDTKNPPETPEPNSQTDEVIERAIGRIPRFTGECTELTAAVPRRGARNLYEVCKNEIGTSVTSERTPIWALVDEERIQVARISIGGGSVTMLAAQPFGNYLLFFGDHGLLFTAVTQLHSGDAVYFISEGDDASLLALIWRHGAPVLVLCLVLVALWLWRGALRFGPAVPATETAQRSLAQQIRGTGRFVVRTGAGRALHAAVTRAVHEAAAKHIASYSSLAARARTEAIARMTRDDALSLTHALNPETERGSGELRIAISFLETVRRKLMLRNH